MSPKSKPYFKQPWFGGCLGSVLLAVLGVLLIHANGRGLRDWSFDSLFLLKPETQVDDVLVVALTEMCYNNLQADPRDFSRTNHALLLKRLMEKGAKMVVFDIFFINKFKPTDAADKAFADAIRKHGKVVLAAIYEEREQTKHKQVSPPTDLFREAAAGWGLATIQRDTDFAARRHQPGTDRYPSLAWKAAEVLGADVTSDPANRGSQRWLNYYAQQAFPVLRYSDVIRDTLEVSSVSFSNKVVFVGSGEVAGFTGEEKEQVRYPWTWRTQHFLFGVEVHALTFSNLVRQDWMRRLPFWPEAVLVVFTGVLFGYGLTLFRPPAATGIFLGCVVLVSLVAYLLFSYGRVCFSWLVIAGVQLPLALGWSLLFHSIRSYVETQLLSQSLTLYLSPQKVRQILKEPALLKPGGVKQEVSVLFSDVAGFSKHCEMKRCEPDEIMRQLNLYYEAAIACIHKTDGTIIDLAGDSIFAIWNAPQKQPDHIERACESALLLHKKLVSFDKEQVLPWRTRVGLHTGEVCVGNIGSSTHFDYTAVGDPINLASRLEGLNKQLGTNILTTSVVHKVSSSRYLSRWVGNFKFQGFNQAVEVFELIRTKEREDEVLSWREAFAQGMRHFVRREFEEATAAFQRVIELRQGDPSEISYRSSGREKDGPSAFYLERICKGFQPPGEWMGEIDLTEK